MGETATTASEPANPATRKMPFFCSMCRRLFAQTRDDKLFQTWHWSEWTDLIDAASIGCLLCIQLASGLLGDRKEELLPRLRSDAGLNDADITCYCAPDQPGSTLKFSSKTGVGFKGYPHGRPMVSFDLYAPDEIRETYKMVELVGDGVGEVEQRTDNERTWRTISQWLSACSTKHHDCSRFADKAAWMPTRLIDVGAKQDQTVDDEGRIRLVTTSELGSLKSYVTLSHCWGGQVPIQLNDQTRCQLESGYSIKKLPKTFSDAVYTTRRLGMRYIWIDSLCIQQDSEEDWRRESAMMHMVYSESWCNIAATEAKDSSVGLFFGRDPRFIQPFEADIAWGKKSGKFAPHLFFRKDMWDLYVDDNLLERRGWVLQERTLSPRQLSFTRAGVFWECRCLCATEFLPEGPCVSDNDRFYKAFARRLEEIEDARKGPQEGSSQELSDAYLAWRDIFRVYSASKLTKQTDRLIAISGLAKKMQEALADEYLVGMWRSRLLTQLCWQVSYKRTVPEAAYRRPHPLLAPTWSWASTTKPTSTEKYEANDDPKLLPLVEILEIKLQHVTEDTTGQCLGGYLRMRAMLWPALLPEGQTFYPGLSCSIAVVGGWHTAATAWVDDGSDGEEGVEREVFCMPLYFYRPNAQVYGLVLKAVGEGQSGYQRVGRFDMWERLDIQAVKSTVEKMRRPLDGGAEPFKEILIY